MSEIEFLLTDEFVAFSGKIAEIHNKRKAKQVEIQELFNKGKAELTALDLEAKKLNEEFEAFKAQKVKK